jgi:hypothetical protein
VASDRSRWPIRRYQLGSEPSDDLTGVTTAEERIAMMWPMAREGWLVSGRQLPSYQRSEMPTRLYRPGEPRDDED